MKTTERKAYFGCRLDSDLIDQVRRLAKYNRRTIGGELARILKFALPVMAETDKRMKRAEEEAWRIGNRAAIHSMMEEEAKKKEFLAHHAPKLLRKKNPNKEN